MERQEVLFKQTFTLVCTSFAALFQIMTDIEGKQEWKDCLDMPGVRLPQGYYFGVSSATGDLSGLDKWNE